MEVLDNRNHHRYLNWAFSNLYRFFGTQEKSALLSEYCFVEWGFRRRKITISDFWYNHNRSWIFSYSIAIFNVNQVI